MGITWRGIPGAGFLIYNIRMVIFINGSINAGKSTVAELLSKKIGNAVVLEIDALRDMIPWVPLEESIPINLENAASLIRNFKQAGLNVIVPYPLSRKNFDFLKEKLGKDFEDCRFFTLSPTLKTAATNRGKRELNDWEKERVKYHYGVGINKPDFGDIIDNTHQTPEETTDLIFKSLS